MGCHLWGHTELDTTEVTQQQQHGVGGETGYTAQKDLKSINNYNMGEGKMKRVCFAAAAKSLQSCPTLCDPIDGSPPGSPVPGILEARTLDWVAISFSNAGK